MSKETKEQLKKTMAIDPNKIAAEIEEEVQQDEIITLPNGIRVKFRSVAPDLIRKVREKIHNPIIPMVTHPNDAERMMENPYDSDYQEGIRVATEKRGDAVMQAMMLRGVELVDGMPEDEEWLDDLVFLDLVDEKDIGTASDKLKEVWYKRFIAIDIYGFDLLQKKIGLNEEMVAQARTSFQRN